MALKPFEWKDRPAFIEKAFPAGKISAESYKEQMAGSGKLLTCLGSYWKGRKPLVLAKACILGTLLPATEVNCPEAEDSEELRQKRRKERLKDLEIFELLMGMDKNAMRLRLAGRLSSKKAAEAENADRSFSFREQVAAGLRAEEMDAEELYGGIWDRVNARLGTEASSMQELVEEMGIARFGHRPRIADCFSGSGQIPFEAARLGCDVYASDLNPVACMLTWGAFNVVGAGPQGRDAILKEQKSLAERVQKIVDGMGIEEDGGGWRSKAYLYCVETRCPQSGWLVPMLTTRIVSRPRTGLKNNVCLKLVPDPERKRYGIEIVQFVKDSDLHAYEAGTVQNGYLVHSPDGVQTFRTSVKDIRGDYRDGGETRNRLRLWEKTDFVPRPDDIYQERLFCVQWAKRRGTTARWDYEFRSVTDADLERERKVEEFVRTHLAEWQEKGFVPDMLIEKGKETSEPIRTRGWTHWHHLFCPRQLLIAGLVNSLSKESGKFGLTSILNWSSRLSIWGNLDGGGGAVKNVFYNQVLNTTFVFGCRTTLTALPLLELPFKNASLPVGAERTVCSSPADKLDVENDIYVTDPPYGNAVKYEEITEFFIAWLRKNPPKMFSNWKWDSRRVLAIKGEDENFRQKMIAAYSAMREHMPDNGLQILMFTHKSGSIWADVAGIVWASGLRVEAAWCVATETDSALRHGSSVKSTVILVLRKRVDCRAGYRCELGDEIKSAVKDQIQDMTWLNQDVAEKYSEALYSDADLQMAGYAAALKVLTSYAVIDGKDMVAASKERRIATGKGDVIKNLVDFAEQTAVMFLVPDGIAKDDWEQLSAIERFYLKMAELEARNENSLDICQRFAKAFKVGSYETVMSHASKANSAWIALGLEMKGEMMSGGYELAGTPLRALLHAVYSLEEAQKNPQKKRDAALAPVDLTLRGLQENCPNFFSNRHLLVSLARFLAQKRNALAKKRPVCAKEAECLRVVAEALANQKVM